MDVAKEDTQRDGVTEEDARDEVMEGSRLSAVRIPKESSRKKKENEVLFTFVFSSLLNVIT